MLDLEILEAIYHVNVIFFIYDCSAVNSENLEKVCTQMVDEQTCMEGDQEIPQILSGKSTQAASQQASSGPIVDLNVL